ncbi:dienelactone hydrolase family protein [Rhodoblastus acidophilus]|uniref:Dienelactone hydrolase family protein n=1 Tax=Candidatus Rhodoblastus alkanivorans TaxID=2954117 RepID=A0ABS9Z809_9HYPH|nr:dienelactone hydrolase family protein [Candidatus Rhodoblastus alkanivorans]MCI4677887.1 dienelactone hydrolase family protein [Candidatus Rhodoblastus alkanivorans]MCI4683783.1 dienelactone hydrolase family protein [Candidatus Rhodoblastus alkanivorans]MDI4641101.1 dienelactone hydrolase family protein [Rhodoblastus acidophilus]
MSPSEFAQNCATAKPLSRRAFVAASAAGGYALAAGPLRAAPIATDTQGLVVGGATIATTGGEMPGYFARPQGVARPPVVLVAMEIFGLHEYIRDVARRLAKLGAFAVAPDYYFRSGVDLTKMTDVSAIMPIVNAKPDAELISDLDAAVAWAKAQGGDTDRLGIIGFCRGGRTVWIYCSESAAPKAGVAFYGTLADPPERKPLWPKSPLDLAPELKAPVLGLYGGEDKSIPVAKVEEMQARLAAAGKTAEFHIYPDAPHGFHADYRQSYRKQDAEDAWRRMAEWLRRYGVLS